MVASVDAWGRHERLSVSHLHIDLKSAFDVILRQLLIGPHSDVGHEDETDNAEDLTLAQMWLNIAAFFERHTLPLLHSKGVPEELCDVLRNMEAGFWARLPGISRVLGESFASLPTGVRQGCSLSPWLFAVYLSAATASIDQRLRDAGLDWSVPLLSGFNAAGETAQSVEFIAFHSLLYADDILYMRAAADGQLLLRQNRHILQIAKATFAEYSLLMNQSAGKTELAIHFAAKASELKAGIMADSKAWGLDKPTLPLTDGSVLFVNSSYLAVLREMDITCLQASERDQDSKRPFLCCF
eukprot:1027861-Amphidinium_carterae.2